MHPFCTVEMARLHREELMRAAAEHRTVAVGRRRRPGSSRLRLPATLRIRARRPREEVEPCLP